MKKTIIFIYALPLALMLHSVEVWSDARYIRHRCDTYKYEITVPADWETDEVTLQTKHIFVSYSNQSEIRVRAFITDEASIEPTVRKRRWNLRAIDPLLQNIIDTGKIRIRKNVRDSLLVFEYRSNNKKILQRTMICKNGNMVYVVDCKSPTKIFYRNEKHFNVAMSSFSVYGSDGQNSDLLDDFKSSIPGESGEEKTSNKELKSDSKDRRGPEEDFFELE